MSENTAQPIPQGQYLPALRHNNLIYTSGMTPRTDGKLIYSGKIKSASPVESYRDAVRLATKNALISAQACLEKNEKISVILQLTVYLNTEPGFREHPKVADYASALLIEELGATSIGSRAAIGVATLPSDALVEIALVGAVGLAL
jgi:enamine deaminase RidA (YjgF/YER057c/UK114 family)